MRGLAMVAGSLAVACVSGCAVRAGDGEAPSADRGRALQTMTRGIPAPLPGNPGNVFLPGAPATVPVPAGVSGAARVVWSDPDGVKVAEAAVGEAVTAGVGWYRLRFSDAAGTVVGETTAAVLAPLGEPVPQDSPVCVDSATAWFARDNRQRQEVFANLAALAGANWIRDRMSWGQVETAAGVFADDTPYDWSADVQSKHGLKVLQVHHSTPGWAADKALDGETAWKRFPRDLRHAHAFSRAMAERYAGRVQAWEPWNEANIPGFGGHVIDEMCALQKASYLGLKAGNPGITACWNVYAGSGSELHTEGVIRNEVSPYFDTYNIHSYGKASGYTAEFAPARRAAAGKPLWISECGIRLNAVTDAPWGDLGVEDDVRQAEFIPLSYANSLYAGVNRHFFFILGNYIENGVQFGLLRHDQTPRPGYSALAAVGRFLAGGRCLGKVAGEGPVEAFAFSSRVDGAPATVFVLHATEPTALPAYAVGTGVRLYDCFGRPTDPGRLGSRPLFAVATPEAAEGLDLLPPAAVDPAPAGAREPSPVVLQAEFPADLTVLGSQAHRLPAGRETVVPVHVYNFGNRTVSGTPRCLSAPDGWLVSLPGEAVDVAPGERVTVPCRLTLPVRGADLFRGAWVTLGGDFGAAGRPVAAFRLIGDVRALEPAESRPVAAAREPGVWVDNIVGGSTLSHAPDGDWMRFTMQFGETDPWSYPFVVLPEADYCPGGMDGLLLSIQLLEGEGTLRVQFVEESGAMYLAELDLRGDVREPQRAVARFGTAGWQSHSKPDPDGVLKPEEIRRVLVGINSKRGSRVVFRVRDMAWVRY